VPSTEVSIKRVRHSMSLDYWEGGKKQVVPLTDDRNKTIKGKERKRHTWGRKMQGGGSIFIISEERSAEEKVNNLKRGLGRKVRRQILRGMKGRWRGNQHVVEGENTRGAVKRAKRVAKGVNERTGQVPR